MYQEETFILGLVSLLVLAKILEIPFRKYKLHPVVAHVIAGIILGPYVLGIVYPSPELMGIASFGLLLLMFYTGLTTDFRELRRHGSAVVLMGAMGVTTTFLLVLVTSISLGVSLLAAIFLAAVLSNTATETVAAIVAHRSDVKSKSLLVGASFVDDIMAVFIIGIIAGLNHGVIDLESLVILSIKTTVFLAVTFYISGLLSRRFMGFYKTISHDYLWFATSCIMLALGLAFLARMAGLSELIGAYLAGILIGRGREFHDPFLRTRIAISEFISDFTIVLDVIFIPLFFTYIGVAYVPRAVDPLLYAALLAMAIFGKFIGAMPIAYKILRDKRKSIAVGLAMSGRGALETALLNLGLSIGVINQTYYSTAITVAITTTILAPILYMIAYPKE